MSKALDANHAGILSALQQQSTANLHVLTKEILDTLVTSAVENANVAANLNHHEKKFVYRAAKFNDLTYVTSVEIKTPDPTAAAANIVHGAAANDVQFYINWTAPATHVTSGQPANVALTFENSNNQAMQLTAGNGTNKWTMTYSTHVLDYANTSLAFTNSNISPNGGTIEDSRGKPVGLNITAPSNITRITITDA